MEEKIRNNSTDKTDSQTTLKELKEKIRKKYPVEKARGSNKKYSEY